MKNRKNILDKVALKAELPGECAPGAPLVEIVEDRRVLIENHRGVVNYTCNEICVKVSYGQICVLGSYLQLARMTKHQLVITGQIEGLTLNRRCKK